MMFQDVESMPAQFVTQWQVSDSTIDHVLDKTMHILKEKEIAVKRPLFSCAAALMDMSKAINLKAIEHDERKDDIYLVNSDAEEKPPPREDNIGKRTKALPQKGFMVARTATKEVTDKIDNMLLSLVGKTRDVYRRPSALSKKSSAMSFVSKRDSILNAGDKSSQASTSPTRIKRRTNSAKKRAMEKKLQAYYQSLCQPVSKYGFQHEKETMLDGTDVDAQIRKKRAHQLIMAEAFNS